MIIRWYRRLRSGSGDDAWLDEFLDAADDEMLEALSRLDLDAGLAAIIYFANATLTARHIAYCNRRYAAAHGPADSGATDTLQLTRSGTITCGDFRRAGRLVPPP